MLRHLKIIVLDEVGEANINNNVVTQNSTDQAGAIVGWDTLDNPDKDFISTEQLFQVWII